MNKGSRLATIVKHLKSGLNSDKLNNTEHGNEPTGDVSPTIDNKTIKSKFNPNSKYKALNSKLNQIQKTLKKETHAAIYPHNLFVEENHTQLNNLVDCMVKPQALLAAEKMKTLSLRTGTLQLLPEYWRVTLPSVKVLERESGILGRVNWGSSVLYTREKCV